MIGKNHKAICKNMAKHKEQKVNANAKSVNTGIESDFPSDVEITNIKQ
jgi:hypothetical protein